MSEEQLSALLAKLKEDSGLMEKLSGAADLDAAVEMAKKAGFDVSADDWHKYQASQDSVTSEELAAISGGKGSTHFNLTPAEAEEFRLRML
jgi:predicted ribosomally synthesized peptide with nif11-like leader